MSIHVAVLGAGTMGRGIAQVAAVAGHDTQLFDVSAAALASAEQAIGASVRKLIEKGTLPGDRLGRLAAHLRCQCDLAAALTAADLVIEAVPEDPQLKGRILTEAATHVRSECIIASNTSSLSITKLAGVVPHPQRFIGMHFFNPVPLMELVEIVVGADTAPATTERVQRWAREFGKTPIVVRDSPGFASSRLGVALGLEAIRMLEAGVASAEDIDRAMKLGYRHPMGPLELTDLVGLDVRLAIAEYLHREIGEQFRPPELLRRLVREGHLGKKSGRGFYDYELARTPAARSP